jgi:hypothetical protein
MRLLLTFNLQFGLVAIVAIGRVIRDLFIFGCDCLFLNFLKLQPKYHVDGTKFDTNSGGLEYSGYARAIEAA